MTSKENLFISSTPDDVKNAKGLSLITQNTPNGQATQILLEELAVAHGIKWDTKLINISTNVQKEECSSVREPSGKQH
jgi:glutathione S-transferase